VVQLILAVAAAVQQVAETQHKQAQEDRAL
jgi:hypothetical protein